MVLPSDEWLTAIVNENSKSSKLIEKFEISCETKKVF